MHTLYECTAGWFWMIHACVACPPQAVDAFRLSDANSLFEAALACALFLFTQTEAFLGKTFERVRLSVYERVSRRLQETVEYHEAVGRAWDDAQGRLEDLETPPFELLDTPIDRISIGVILLSLLHLLVAFVFDPCVGWYYVPLFAMIVVGLYVGGLYLVRVRMRRHFQPVEESIAQALEEQSRRAMNDRDDSIDDLQVIGELKDARKELASYREKLASLPRRGGSSGPQGAPPGSPPQSPEDGAA